MGLDGSGWVWMGLDGSGLLWVALDCSGLRLMGSLNLCMVFGFLYIQGMVLVFLNDSLTQFRRLVVD